MTDLATNFLYYGHISTSCGTTRPDAAGAMADERPVAGTSVFPGARVFALLTIAVLVGACSTNYRPAEPPTLAETQAFISKMVQLAQAGEFGQLCKLGGGNCERILETAGTANVPADPPTIARIYIVPSVEHADGSWSQGGQMVEMCGNDQSGASYQTQMIVFRDPAEGVIAIEPIYWSGLGIIVGAEPPVTEPSGPAFAC